MSIKLSDSIRVGQQKPLEDKYFNELVPYTSTSQVNTLLPKAVRHIGLTVNIDGEEYWYKDGIEDANLVLKVPNMDTFILKNQEQDDRLENLEGENAFQNDRLFFLEEIYYVWTPTNRELTLYDGSGKLLSRVSLLSLDNEGTDLRYNATTLSLELYNANNELLDSIPVSSFIGSVGTQLQLNSNQLQLKDSQGNVLSTVSFTVSNIKGLQTALDSKENISNKQNSLINDVTNTKYPTVTAVNNGLATKLDKGGYEGTAQDLKNDIDTKQKKLSSFDESILIESDGNIEGNVSLFTEYFNQQICELNFIPTQIIGVYQDGIKLLPEEFNITLPKTITIKTYSTEKIEIQYTHLKN